MAFDAQEYVDAYKRDGTLPAIHRDMGELIRRYSNGVQCAIDFGACTGLLSIAAVRAGIPRVIAVEGSQKSIGKAPQSSCIQWVKLTVEPLSHNIDPTLEQYRPQLAIMRRVLPEISGGDVDVARAFIRTLGAYGVKTILLEGRVNSPRSKHPLRSIEEEIACCLPYYALDTSYRSCAAMCRVSLQ